MFIENIEEQDKPISIDEIIDPISKKLYSNETNKFEILHKELKENNEILQKDIDSLLMK